MKKNLIVAAGAMLVAAAVSTFVYVNNEKEGQTSFFKANVEALANDENPNTGISGKCDDEPKACLYICSCGRIWDSMTNTGPAWGVTGTCVCGTKVK